MPDFDRLQPNLIPKEGEKKSQQHTEARKCGRNSVESIFKCISSLQIIVPNRPVNHHWFR